MIFLNAAHDHFDPLYYETGFLFWSAITFAILLAILYKIGWGPLTKAIEDRESKIRGDIDAAEKARAEAEADMARYKKQLDEAAEEAKRLLQDAREAAERAKESIVTEAKEQAEGLRQQATREIEAARDKAMAEIKGYIVDVAMAASKRFVAGSVDEATHKRLVDEVLAKTAEHN
ncbi:MAG: F0F1 ATP synthase subunit B [Planctomycetes bacterium]|nr:F0F1 ATP synthase subunit B [Planctomycetota bacterium]